MNETLGADIREKAALEASLSIRAAWKSITRMDATMEADIGAEAALKASTLIGAA